VGAYPGRIDRLGKVSPKGNSCDSVVQLEGQWGVAADKVLLRMGSFAFGYSMMAPIGDHLAEAAGTLVMTVGTAAGRLERNVRGYKAGR
jgi:hypothetical protein